MTEREGLPPFCAVLGATGSVGTQALDVARTQHIPVRLMTARRDVAGMETRIRTFHPQTVVMTEEAAAKDLRVRIADTDTRVLAGAEAVCGEIDRLRPPVVIHAILGEAGLAPAFAAVDAGCRVGLANKETVVIAGELLMQRAAEKGAVIVPVDSEHSAIFQCLKCGRKEEVRRIWLTASGGTQALLQTYKTDRRTRRKKQRQYKASDPAPPARCQN